MRALSSRRLRQRLWSIGVQPLPVRDVLERIRSYRCCSVWPLHGRDILERVRGDRCFRVQSVWGRDVLWWRPGRVIESGWRGVLVRQRLSILRMLLLRYRLLLRSDQLGVRLLLERSRIRVLLQQRQQLRLGPMP